MKKFKGHRSFDQIAAQCKEQGLAFECANYVLRGSDYVGVFSGGVRVLYNTSNGRFFGTHLDGRRFSESSAFDGEPWFDALLNFFYYTEGPIVERPMSMVDATLGGVPL